MEYAYQSDVGKRREDNQDFAGVFKNEAGALFAVVADGMGGHQGGDVASEMAVSHLGHDFSQTDLHSVEDVVKWLIYDLQRENDKILAVSDHYADLRGMGTTFVAVIVVDNQYIVANIGDSRCYRYAHGTLEQLTEDHSLVNELLKHGEISPEEAAHHPQKNVITRTLGVSSDADADVTVFDFGPDEYLLLCSDGLTNMVSDADIQEVLATQSALEDKCAQLIDWANDAGGLDNITVLIMHRQGGDDHDGK
ncbi:Stp1/IreP family PP2C-type Ser/Thr phosphatase [Schleiferilactobacillus perolens]|jgi:protein phosphatase|uniref:protein-serine/threonine phosphatase n=1 Tax=Schleiferilactobacillus perolens DSM 12744 TaxID=1423792 RepID=A0A0R1MY34_9LACO|nr:Stp1/IreP family PP2C-type Ser/Thr phosphatase [Schleiferilactobacillus perolens]KRL12945.1 serine threonine phosphatase stp [Schleiferilactobacillus perolens DSM 12744]MCI1892690.1 Stp1/IreP family PP2C-type Ser/Thr phosphatase [Schleiferilactobacillus harbinensis]MCI1911771.1 Stp1/IreP family PP2C-type Ser/Thr phosphatase [Schleiferilactobacillus harbinensis]MCI2172497.1 Stp1/IreP family PP2C-type Ser/Thr phosphatase [Schleiferilactobacillus perolens]